MRRATDRLDARLLDRLEHGAALLAAGNELAVNGGIMTGHPQRHRIGMTAHDGGVFADSACAAAPASRALPPARPGRSAAKETLKLGLTRNGAQAAAYRALERLVWELPGLGLGFGIRGHEAAGMVRLKPKFERKRIVAGAFSVIRQCSCECDRQ